MVAAINRAVREHDEWFDDPDDLDRVQRALDTVGAIDDPIRLAAVLTYRITRTQGFAEGNKRMALLVGKWVLDRNGVDGCRIIPTDDRLLADLLVRAASGADVESEIVNLFDGRR